MAVLIIVVALSILAANIYRCQSLSCGELPKQDVPSIKNFSENGPYTVDYSLTHSLDCIITNFNYPARGVTNYNGSVIDISGDTALVYDYVVDSDGKRMNGTICATGVTSVWYVAAAEFDSRGAFYCLYSCNGPELAEFACGSNNNGASPNELIAVNEANTVANGHLIHDSKQNCPGRHGCHVY